MTAESVLVPSPLAFAEERTSGRPNRPMDEAQFDAFYRKTAAGLWSYMHRLTGDPAVADDLVQKAFFRFLRANPALSGDEHMRAWLYRTATNLALDHFREVKRGAAAFLGRWTTGEAPVAPLELRHDLSRVFAELKPQERALLWLAHVEESNHEEIGEALGVKAKSVRVLLFRARKRLAELLTRRGIGPEALR
ncbi:MAG TPA: RNA polymerase sigma factor [Thermoanaerobaculia bacterium]|nr:RNA polymerase sigma factor [Thermoanaerobaculia bacterium]